MFNNKAMTLFHKTNEQLRKELERRGLSHHAGGSSDAMIANIIWKDAYDEGRNDERRNARTCPLAKEEVTSEYMLVDDEGTRFKMTLTDDQVAFWDWLYNHDMLNPDIEMNPFDETYTTVGRIKKR